MKTKPIPTVLLALVGLAAFPLAGCSDSTETTVVAASPDASTTPPPPAVVPAPGVVAPVPAPDEPPAANVEWADIKDLEFDDRADFIAGLERLKTRLDQRIEELKAKRAAITSDVDPVEWDNAMKALANARVRLLSRSTDIAKATPENWSQRKEQVALAWEDVQESYEKAVTESTR